MDESDWTTARIAMVASQLERRGICEPGVLDAMRRVPRHLFVPPNQRASAYEDRALRIGGGQTISQPYMAAIMTVALGPLSGKRILEVGTGSGYQAAILATLAGEVTSIERRPDLAEESRRSLAILGYANVTVIVGDGSLGHAPSAPYDGIMVTAGAPRVPDVLKTQLADGARLVVPVGSREYQELVVVQRVGRQFTEVRAEACVFVPLIGSEGWPDG